MGIVFRNPSEKNKLLAGLVNLRTGTSEDLSTLRPWLV